MLSQAFALLVISTAIMARPPTPDEAKEEVRQQQVNNDSKDDYDVLPAVDHIPESFKESLKKQKMRYLKMLQQHHL